MKISSIIFFSVVLIISVSLPISIYFGLELLFNIIKFWWAILLPIAIVKIFYKQSKLAQWLGIVIYFNKTRL